VLLVVETTDIVFAVDSIPAIFRVTRQPFIVFSATALALLGLRSMYFLLAGARDRFAYLDVGLAVILVFVGMTFLLTDVVHIGGIVSLAVIVGVMGAAIAPSLLPQPPSGVTALAAVASPAGRAGTPAKPVDGDRACS
jgi:tellurite resistance protein TerC